VSVEFIDAVTKDRIGISAAPVAIPTLGEEITFEEESLTRSFRVVNVAYVMQSRKGTGEALQKKLTRIVVTLEMMESEADQTA
jgi:hypothetical protein